MIPEITKKILKATKSSYHLWNRGRVSLVQNTVMQPSYTIHWTAPGIESDGCKYSDRTQNDRILAGLTPEWSDSDPMDGLEGVQRSLICLDGLWAAVVECWGYTSGDRTSRSLNGVCISGRDGYRGAVATDGHRLRFIPGEWAQEDTCLDREGDWLIIPNEVIKIAKPLAKTLHAVITYDKQGEVVIPAKPEKKNPWTGEMMVAVPEHTEITHTRFVEMQWITKEGQMFSAWWNATEFAPYPNFVQVVPKQFATEQLLDGGDLRKAIKAAAPLVPKTTQQIEFERGQGGYSNPIKMQYMNHDLGIKEYVTAGTIQAIPQRGNEFITNIGFNLKYLEQVIGKEDKLLFKFNSPVQAVVVERSQGFCIIMPLRIPA